MTYQQPFAPPPGQLPPQQIVVPDLGALKQPTPAPMPSERLLDVEVRWAGVNTGPGCKAKFANVAVGRDQGLGMMVLESQEEGGGAYLIPPGSIRWMRVLPHGEGQSAIWNRDPDAAE